MDQRAGANALIQRQQQKLQEMRHVQELHQKTLAEDASAFAYDEVYEDMKGKQKAPVGEAGRAAPQQSKYIGTLKAKAIERQLEQDVVFVRRQARLPTTPSLHLQDVAILFQYCYKKLLIAMFICHLKQGGKED